MMDLGRCLFCGSPAVHLHHPTGRLGPELPYLDPSFTIPLCRACHHAEHAAMRDVGLDLLTDPLLARLVRMAWLLGRLADTDRSVTFTVGALKGMHGCLLAAAGLTEAMR